MQLFSLVIFLLRVPGHADHRFRRKPITCSGMPITDSGAIDQSGMT
jgi:hypothetical protein